MRRAWATGRLASWRELFGSAEAIIAQLGFLSDFIVVKHTEGLTEESERVFSAGAFEPARPLMIVPETMPADLTRHIIVAWNGSPQAIRAVLSAMRLLIAAEHVSVFSVPETANHIKRPLDLVEQLSWRGIRANHLRPVVRTASIGSTLLEVAGHQRATLVVMGAYSHNRVRERLFGGVTAHVMTHMTLPVLMVH